MIKMPKMGDISTMGVKASPSGTNDWTMIEMGTNEIIFEYF